jgi:hypothetical protein
MEICQTGKGYLAKVAAGRFDNGKGNFVPSCRIKDAKAFETATRCGLLPGDEFLLIGVIALKTFSRFAFAFPACSSFAFAPEISHGQPQ